jgi:hypothetical protein
MAAVGQPQQALNMGTNPLPAGITREHIQQTYMVSLSCIYSHVKSMLLIAVIHHI